MAACVASRRDDRFIAYSDGTVLDTMTGLMWAANDNGENINWDNAKNYCESCLRGGLYKLEAADAG